MGLALADEAFKNGDEVVLVTTKEVERPYKVVKVKSALEMQNAVNAKKSKAQKGAAR